MNRFSPKNYRPDPDATLDSGQVAVFTAQDIRGFEVDITITTAHVRSRSKVMTRHTLECGDAILDLTPEVIDWLMEELMMTNESLRA